MESIIKFFKTHDICNFIITYFLYFLDLLINVIILIYSYIVQKKIKESKSKSHLMNFLKTVVKITYSPCLIFYVVYIFANDETMFLGRFDENIVLYLWKIKKFVYTSVVLLCFRNVLKIICEKYCEKKVNVEKSYKTLEISIFSKIIDTITIVVVLAVFLISFEIKILTIFFAIGTPLTLLTYIAKSNVEDFLAAIYLHISNSFKINDLINIQGINVNGYIKKFNLKNVEILTQSNEIILVRNSMLVNNLVINKSKSDSFLINLRIDIVYEDFNNVIDFSNNLKDFIASNKDFFEGVFSISFDEVSKKNVVLKIIILVNSKNEAAKTEEFLMQHILNLSTPNCNISRITKS